MKKAGERRERKLTVEEIFAGAYMLCARCHDPCTDKLSDIFEVMEALSLKLCDLFKAFCMHVKCIVRVQNLSLTIST